MLLKCVVEMHVLPRRYLPRCILQYIVSPSKADGLLSFEPTAEGTSKALDELDAFDPCLARSLRNMLTKDLSTEEYPLDIGSFDGSANEDPITNENKAECIVAKVKRVLLRDNKGALDCMRDGFRLRQNKGSTRNSIDLTLLLAVSAQICVGVLEWRDPQLWCVLERIEYCLVWVYF
jgi:hypothetical protein